MTPEEKARQQIDAQLLASGWVVQTKVTLYLSAARGVAVCELSFAKGEPDYILFVFVDSKALGTSRPSPAVTRSSSSKSNPPNISHAPATRLRQSILPKALTGDFEILYERE